MDRTVVYVLGAVVLVALVVAPYAAELLEAAVRGWRLAGLVADARQSATHRDAGRPVVPGPWSCRGSEDHEERVVSAVQSLRTPIAGVADRGGEARLRAFRRELGPGRTLDELRIE